MDSVSLTALELFSVLYLNICKLIIYRPSVSSYCHVIEFVLYLPMQESNVYLGIKLSISAHCAMSTRRPWSWLRGGHAPIAVHASLSSCRRHHVPLYAHAHTWHQIAGANCTQTWILRTNRRHLASPQLWCCSSVVSIYNSHLYASNSVLHTLSLYAFYWLCICIYLLEMFCYKLSEWMQVCLDFLALALQSHNWFWCCKAECTCMYIV